jgi:hypothetical protein
MLAALLSVWVGSVRLGLQWEWALARGGSARSGHVQLGWARPAVGMVTRSARFSPVRSRSARLGTACSGNEA